MGSDNEEENKENGPSGSATDVSRETSSGVARVAVRIPPFWKANPPLW